jgi:hypothetical protein
MPNVPGLSTSPSQQEAVTGIPETEIPVSPRIPNMADGIQSPHVSTDSFPTIHHAKVTDDITAIVRNIFQILQKELPEHYVKTVLPSSKAENPIISGMSEYSTDSSETAVGKPEHREPSPIIPENRAILPPRTVRVINEQVEKVFRLVTSFRQIAENHDTTSIDKSHQIEKISEKLQILSTRLAHYGNQSGKSTTVQLPPHQPDPETLMPSSVVSAFQSANESDVSLPALLREAVDVLRRIIDLLQPEAEKMETAKTLSHGRGTIEGEQALPPRPSSGADTHIPGNEITQRQISQALTNAINRLESLQLLARQVPTNEGFQQIIALPIKVGDQWTDVNIRLLRQKKRKNAKDGSRFSVFLDVAPKSLGALHVHLEYQVKKQLQLSVEFERKSTRDWFAGHRKEIHDALSATGISVGHVHLTMGRKKTSSKVRSETGASDKVIDIQV